MKKSVKRIVFSPMKTEPYKPLIENDVNNPIISTRKGSETALLILNDLLMNDKYPLDKAMILKKHLNDKVVISEEKWLQTPKDLQTLSDISYDATIENLRLYAKLERIKALIENSLRTKQENLKLYNPSEPIYAKMCGEMEVLEKLKNEVDEE